MISSHTLILVELFLTFFYNAYNAAELTLRDTVYNTDVATAGIGDGLYTRVGATYTATLSFPGVTGTVNEAYLYWYKLTASTVATDSITFDGTTITGNDIGIASTNCWGSGFSQVFLADITSLITGAAASYSIPNITPDTRGGRHTAYNGFSLIVFFDDGNDSNNHDVVLYDGNDSNTPNAVANDPAGWNIVLGGINYPASGTAGLELHISDGQIFGDGTIVINGNSQPLTANGNQGNLFDIVSIDVTAFMTPNAENTLTITHARTSDCLSAIVALITLPPGAAPKECFDTNEKNPCTSENIAADHLYHSSCSSCCRFIQCDAWGTAFDMPCGAGTYWDPEAYTCNHNVGQCTDIGCSLSPIAGAAIQLKQIGDGNGNVKNKNNAYNYYAFILLIGVIAFILINNAFIGCFCLNKHKNKQYRKCDMVGVNVDDMDEI